LAYFVVLASVGILPSAGGGDEGGLPERSWAMPLGLSEPENAYQVSDVLYRGARMSREGATQLRSLGIKTVVSLRVLGADGRYITRVGLDYVQIPSKAWRPEEEQVVQFLKVATDPCRQPVYVYCYHGADRTGLMSAAYRVVVEGWTKDEAIEEMTAGPFGYHPRWHQLVEFIRDMDVERIRGMMDAE
jgi:protein tyrosine phosphatase (PTP) superfamily phosphohydrolase (DUF442 family)